MRGSRRGGRRSRGQDGPPCGLPTPEPMRVVRLPAHNPGPFTGAGSNTWLVPGARPTLVDAGSGEGRHLDALAEALDVLQGDRGALAQVLVTHAHPDHAGGAPAMAARWPGAAFRKHPWPEVDGRWPVPWQPISGGDIVEAGDGALRVIHTPGHSPDHVCLFEPLSATLFAGDLVMNGGTVVVPASAGGSMTAYLDSLERILELGPRRIYPGHGDPIDEPAPLIRSYLAHRLARERQILDVLARGPARVPEIVRAIYAGVPEALRRAAGENVLAHLLRLEEHGRAGRDEGAVAAEAVWHARA